MSIFSSASKKTVSERLIKGHDYIEVLDGNQVVEIMSKEIGAKLPCAEMALLLFS